MAAMDKNISAELRFVIFFFLKVGAANKQGSLLPSVPFPLKSASPSSIHWKREGKENTLRANSRTLSVQKFARHGPTTTLAVRQDDNYYHCRFNSLEK